MKKTFAIALISTAFAALVGTRSAIAARTLNARRASVASSATSRCVRSFACGEGDDEADAWQNGDRP